MCTSGTPLCVWGGPSHNFQAKTQDVVVPLSVHTMQKQQCSFYIPLWDFMGLGISASHPQTQVGIRMEYPFVPYPLSLRLLTLMVFLLLAFAKGH